MAETSGSTACPTQTLLVTNWVPPIAFKPKKDQVDNATPVAQKLNGVIPHTCGNKLCCYA